MLRVSGGCRTLAGFKGAGFLKGRENFFEKSGTAIREIYFALPVPA
jgi:hypothetical protein